MKNKLSFGRSSALLWIGVLSIFVMATIYRTATAQSGNAGGLRLPFQGTASSDHAIFVVENTSERRSPAIEGKGWPGLIGRTTRQGGVGIVGLGSFDETSAGVEGRSLGKGFGVYGQSPDGVGIKGVNGPPEAGNTEGILGDKSAGVKGYARTVSAYAMYGSHEAGAEGFIGSKEIGVQGAAVGFGGGKGVAGKAEGGANAVGVYGQSASGIAGFFRGKVTITESLLVNHIYAEDMTGAAKLFRIDHPLEPAHKYLSHASVESNEMANLTVEMSRSGRMARRASNCRPGLRPSTPTSAISSPASEDLLRYTSHKKYKTAAFRSRVEGLG